MQHQPAGGNSLGLQLADVVWRKSIRSGPYSDNCVEIAFAGGGVAVRDSKDQAGPVQTYTPAEWAAFVDGVKDGEFDMP